MATVKKIAGPRKDDPESVDIASVVDKKAKPVESLRKAKRGRLTNTRLRKLADKHKPPQSWYEKNEDDLC